MHLNQLLVILTAVYCGESARILGIAPIPSYSHQIVFRPIFEALARKGHEVVVLTTHPREDANITNLREIGMSGSTNFFHITEICERNGINVFKMIDEMSEELHRMTIYQLELPEVQQLIKNESEHFDILLLEYLYPTMAVFATRFNIPTIAMISMDALDFIHRSFGNPTHPILYPDIQSPFIPPMSFFERIFAGIMSPILNFYGKTTFALEDVTIRRYFADGYPKLEDIVKNISMLFINTNVALHDVRPLNPNTITIGGGIHITDPKPLPKDLQDFLDNSREGVIYFSLGSNVKARHLSAEKKKILMETFAELPYKVLWKLDEEVADVPKNIRIKSWLPQQDVLRHPNIKLFITQGGVQSTEEAIFNHVPVLVIPIFIDQKGNAMRVEKRQFGLSADKENLSKELLTNLIKEVIENPKYKSNMISAANAARDQPMTGVEKAVWWTEYVIRNKGAKYLRSHAVDIPFYQFFLLDVIGFLLLCFSLISFVVYIAIRWVVLKTRGSNVKSKRE